MHSIVTAALSAIAFALVQTGSGPFSGVSAVYIQQFARGHIIPNMNSQSRHDIENCSKNWKVKPTDTCTSITSSFVGLTNDALVQLNPGFTCQEISSYVGQLLCLQARNGTSGGSTSETGTNSTSTTTTGGVTEHVCYTNHTLTDNDLKNVFVFAQDNNVTVTYIMAINNIPLGRFPSAGTTICIKDNSNTPTTDAPKAVAIQTIVPIAGCTKTIKVTSANNCTQIAKDEGYSINILYSLNTINCGQPLAGTNGTATVCVEAPSVAGSLKHGNSTASSTASGSSGSSGSAAASATTTTSDTPTPTPTPPPPSRDGDTQDGIQKTTNARAIVGLGPLTYDDGYARYASERAQHIADTYAGCAMPGGHEGVVFENSAWWAMTPGYTYPTSGWLANGVETWWEENYYGAYNHYTQLVWPTATVFGCAYAHGEGGACLITICEYDTGNIGGVGVEPQAYPSGSSI
ncbi:hypothetical protein DFJ73DRAFT_656797 [Zopfochytrium polystomum]|nr:hypothetical protein DFJ73DRAFT_656797 [Zopfochytrium polystomum]